MAKRTIQHEPAAPGIAIGRAHLLVVAPATIPRYWITDKELTGEIQRFKKAVQRAKRQLAAIKEKLCRFQGREQIQILESHLLLVQDEQLVSRTIGHIANQKINAEWALDKALEYVQLAFADLSESYFRERRSDIVYVGQRIMKNLLGRAEPDLRSIPYPETIIVAQDLSPAEVAALPRSRAAGFITTTGGNTSHTAIIARSLELPAMVGIATALDMVREGDWLILDAIRGRLLVRPTATEVTRYRREQHQQTQERAQLIGERDLPAITRDGRRITLVANIDLHDEIRSAREHGAEGIGMYRTEYLYLNRTDFPTEEEHYRNYRRVIEAMAPRPVTIRTLDIGGDKLFGAAEYPEHANPVLGLRAVRFCLRESEMFRAQLRAIYRASAHGTVQILFPLISTIDEARTVIALVKEVQQDLKRRRCDFDPTVPLGAMIEVPAAVMMTDHLAQCFQFFSIGTNDLTQYSLAVDRTNEHVAYLFHPLHPAILRLIHHTVAAAEQRQIPLTICGEMAADPLALLPLLGLGLRSLSMNPVSIARVKRLVRLATYAEAKALAEQLLAAPTAEQVEQLARRALQQLEAQVPERVATVTGDTAVDTA